MIKTCGRSEKAWATRLVQLASALLAGCSITLDPTVSRDEGGGNGGVLAACSVFQGGTAWYEFCSEPLAWAAAEHDCHLRGAELASVENEAENTVILNAAQAAGSNVWLGGTRDDELVWAWATGAVFWRGGADGEAAENAFTRWAPDEPNDTSTVSTDPERCLALTLGGADWNDRACTLELPYVCEHGIDE